MRNRHLQCVSICAVVPQYGGRVILQLLLQPFYSELRSDAYCTCGHVKEKQREDD